MPTNTVIDAPSSEPLRTSEAFYAPRPTRFRVFLRTFLPWQVIRFAVINLKMFRIIARSHRAERGPSSGTP